MRSWPHQMRLELTGHDIFTVAYMKWAGVENGELLRRAAADGFDALITTDRGLEYEQNQAALPLAVVVLIAKDNKQATIIALVPHLLRALANLQPRQFVAVAQP